MNKALVKGPRIQLFLGLVESPIWTTITHADLNGYEPIIAGRVGSTPVGFICSGHPGAVVCQFSERDAAHYRQALSMASDGRAIKPGTQLSAITVRMHDPADGDDTDNDWVFPAMVPTDFGQAFAPSGAPGGYSVTFRIQRPDDADSEGTPDFWVGFEASDPVTAVGVVPVEPEPLP